MQPLLTSEPTHVGGYRLLARLGKGAMGAVYLGRSRGGRVVAVKVVRPDLAEDPQFRERFRREAAMARAVGGFWTAAVVDTDPDAEQPWLATEYVPGPTLHQAVTEHGPLPEHTVRGLAAGLAEALGAIHGAGLVHRDLKPANVLLGPDGPRVIDFGISRAMTANAMTATGMFFGTPGYFSPEQTVGSDVEPPSDVFSFGAILVFAATGTGPFGNESTAAMLYRVVHTEPNLTQVPEGLRPLLSACLAKEPKARPTSATILNQVGESSPHGNQWLPSTISELINEHTTRLRQTTNVEPTGQTPDPSGPDPSGGVAAEAAPDGKKPGTRAYTPMMPEPAPAQPARPEAAHPEPARHQQAVASASAPVGSVEQTTPAAPVKIQSTAKQPVPSPRQKQAKPTVRKDNPGPVFTTVGRVSAVFWALFISLVIYGAYLGAPWASLFIRPEYFVFYQLAVVICYIIAGLYVFKAVKPGLRLKVNNDGLLVYRWGLARPIPWKEIQRIGIVGRGKKQAIAVWARDGAKAPSTRWWHYVRRYHGGARVYPIGATGGLLSRHHEIKRVRLALRQYAPLLYDARLL